MSPAYTLASHWLSFFWKPTLMTFLQILPFSYSTKPVLWFSFYYCYLRKKGHPSQRGRGLFTRALYCQTFRDTDFSTLHVYAGGFSAAQSRDSYFLCSDRELCNTWCLHHHQGFQLHFHLCTILANTLPLQVLHRDSNTKPGTPDSLVGSFYILHWLHHFGVCLLSHYAVDPLMF